MRVLEYSWSLPLATAFHAEFPFVKGRITDQDTPCFDECFDAIKKTGCQWSLSETTTRTVDTNIPKDK